MLVLITINSKLPMNTRNAQKIKTLFLKLKSASLHDMLIGWILDFFLRYPKHNNLILGSVKPGDQVWSRYPPF